ncbi:MAG: ribbon-helix-helix protein, CopG family [Propionicimonas sp.]
MTDLLIRNVDEADVRGIDALAARLGISRSELLRREAKKLARRGAVSVTPADLERSASLMVDLLDDEVMGQAW